MILKSLLVAVLGLSLCACQSSQSIKNDAAPEHFSAEVKLTDVEAKNGHLYIGVLSNGCTFINSFKVAVEDASENSIRVIRVKPDLCRMKQREVNLQYSYKHLGLDLKMPVLVVNPIQGMSSIQLAGSAKKIGA